MADESHLWMQSPSGGAWERLGAARDLRIGPSNSSPALAEQEDIALRERLAFLLRAERREEEVFLLRRDRGEERRRFMDEFIGDFEDTGRVAPSQTSATPQPESPSSSTDASGTPARTAGESAAFLREEERRQSDALNSLRYAASFQANPPTTIGFTPGPQYGERMFLAPPINLGLEMSAPSLRQGTVIGEIAVDQARTLARNFRTVVMPNLGRVLEIPVSALMEEGEFSFEVESFAIRRAYGRDTLLVIRLEISPTTLGSGDVVGPSLSPGSTTSTVNNPFHFPAPSGTVMFSTGTVTTNSIFSNPIPPGGTGEAIWTVEADETTRADDEEGLAELDEGGEEPARVITYRMQMSNVLTRIAEDVEHKVLVPTNGMVRKDGRAVMGRGFAASVKNRVKDSDLILGKLITLYGSKVQWIVQNLYAFPTKDDWKNPSTMDIILRSCKELRAIAEGRPGKWYLPLPGCGAGDLDFKVVLPRVAEELGGLDYRLVTTDRAIYDEYERLIYGPPLEPLEVSGQVPF